ncbi:MAG: hypothetical protein LUE14_13610 [Clostridiales bacterium]|nr:hypothetical protein [Clostridiales bacterium]
MKKKILAVILTAGMVLSAGLTGCGSDAGSATSAEDDFAAKAAEFSEEVQNGYLGNYDTVTVKEVIEYLYAGGEWTYGTSNDGTYYVVDYCNEDYVEIQFVVYDDGSETFTVSGMDLFTDDTDSYSSSGVAAFLNSIYRSYINAYPECGLTAATDDEMADEAVLDGHFGPVKSVEESGYATADADTEETDSTDAGDAGTDDSQTEETVQEETAEGTGLEDIDYASVYDYAFGEINESVEYGYYCLWDLNDDGIYELILGHGESSADYVNDVWTVGVDGGILGVGSFYGDTMLYVAPDYNGIYSVYGHMDYQMITRITMVDGGIEEEIISDGELGDGEDYYSNEMEIYLSDISDRSLLEQY